MIEGIEDFEVPFRKEKTCIPCERERKPQRPTLNDTAVYLFKKGHPKGLVTEDSLRADSDLVFEMNDRKIRVQDILNAHINMTSEVAGLLDWWMRRN